MRATGSVCVNEDLQGFCLTSVVGSDSEDL